MRQKIAQVVLCVVSFALAWGLAYAGEVIDKPLEGYIAYIPDAALGGKPAPVIICLPASGTSAKVDFESWRFPCQRQGFALVCLDVEYNYAVARADVLFKRFTYILDALASRYAINLKQMYLAGTSEGGIFSLVLALLKPGDFQGVGIIAGSMLTDDAYGLLRAARQQKFFLIHGADDQHIPIKTAEYVSTLLRRAGAQVEFIGVPRGTQYLGSYANNQVVDWFARLEGAL